MRSSKHSVFWCIAAQNVFRFRSRTLSILIPLIVVMASVSAMTFIKDGMMRDALLSVSMLPDITVQQMEGGRIGQVPVELAGKIASYNNVRKVVPRIWGYVPVQVIGGVSTFTFMGIDLTHMSLAKDISLAIERGRFLSTTDKNCVVIGKGFAAQYGAKSGDKILLKDETDHEVAFSVVGIFSSPVQIYTANLIITDIESARVFMGFRNGQYSDLGVYLKNPEYTSQVAGSIFASYSHVRVLTKDSLSNIIRQGYAGRSGVFQLMWMILLLTVLLLAWSQSSSINMEMKKEIGVLKAIGWQTLDIIELKMMEIVIIGLCGLLGGMLAGIAYLRMGAPVIKQYFLGWAGMYPGFTLPFYIEWSSVFLLFVIGLFPLCAATVFSAWITGTIEPDSAIRNG